MEIHSAPFQGEDCEGARRQAVGIATVSAWAIISSQEGRGDLEGSASRYRQWILFPACELNGCTQCRISLEHSHFYCYYHFEEGLGMRLDDLDPTLSEAGAAPRPESLSPLGRTLKEIRRRFIEEGGKLLAPEELDSEIAERRGAAYRLEDED